MRRYVNWQKHNEIVARVMTNALIVGIFGGVCVGIAATLIVIMSI